METHVMPELVGIFSKHKEDQYGNPAAGKTTGPGMTINWQDGPEDPRLEPNGAFVEHAIMAAIDRLQFVNHSKSGKFKSKYNDQAINLLQAALTVLSLRLKTEPDG